MFKILLNKTETECMYITYYSSFCLIVANIILAESAHMCVILVSYHLMVAI